MKSKRTCHKCAMPALPGFFKDAPAPCAFHYHEATWGRAWAEKVYPANCPKCGQAVGRDMILKHIHLKHLERPKR